MSARLPAHAPGASQGSRVQAKLFVDFHGNAIARHIPNKAWSVRKFLRSLREQKLSWRRIYWKIWGITHSLTCVWCGMQFIGAALGHCHYHPAMPTFKAGDNVGKYDQGRLCARRCFTSQVCTYNCHQVSLL